MTAANELTQLLGLTSAPIGVAFVSARPDGVAEFAGAVPSSCSFWRQAERGVFYAPAEAHYNCAVGAMTMGFALPPAVQQSMSDVVQLMCSCGYMDADEPARMPSIPGTPQGVVYGPLADLPVPPDLVVMWLTPRQAMLFDEAAGDVRWGDQPGMRVLGRPACSSLPIAVQSSRPTLSMGCLGMRTFTEVSDDRMLAVVPAAAIDGFVSRLQATAAANETMAGAYGAMKAQFPG
ncbi:MAG TPA: DUF169 domain-containing protein [Candidatus Dormibacteraeota bacterium]|nr:DUF169 domain-containing protein [Candidatus Dormibacteraeota bacterium]